MEPRISQYQTQKQILSPQIQQYLKLLQMPLVELSQAIEAELSENPMLEDLKIATSDGSTEDNENQEQSRENDEVRLGESFENLEKLDDTFKEVQFSDRVDTNYKEQQKRIDYQETLIKKQETLSDYLLWQIRLGDLSEREEKIAEEIIGNINDDGYFQATIEDIVQSTGEKTENVARILKHVQSLDPPGVGAQDLQEALMLQLKKKGPAFSNALAIVRDHLKLLKRRDFKQIAKILSLSIEEVREAATQISKLEPKPGRTYYTEEPIAITPDATIRMDEENPNEFKIDIHDETVPELRINGYYRKLLRAKTTDAKTKAFLREKLQNAVNFLKAMKLRKSTLRDITEEIIKVQGPFLKKGFAHLVPLRLKDIAEKLQIHESTVSRGIQGKYVATPQGTIPYKSFFSTRLETSSGEAESQKSIMEKIKRLIEQEDPKKPLSDQAIVGLIEKQGIKIARRTVAKYREVLKILPTHLRRER